MRIFFLLILIIPCVAKAQFPSEQIFPVRTEFNLVDSGSYYELSITLEIDSNWIVYDSIVGGEGPLPLEITFVESNNFNVEKLKKPFLHKKYDEIFDAQIYYIGNKATYRYFINRKSKTLPLVVSGSVEFMSCNLSSGVCLPPVNNSFNFEEK